MPNRLRCLYIKVLQTFRLREARFSIDMQVLKDLKKCFSRVRVFLTVGRGPVPRHASIRTGNGLGWRSVFAQVERSRGTGPRATGPVRVFRLIRSGSGEPELQFPLGPLGP